MIGEKIMPLVEALSEEPFHKWPHTFLRYGPQPLANDIG